MRHRKKKCRCLKRERQIETEQGGSPCPPHLPRLTSRRELLSSFCCQFLKAVVPNLSQLCTVRWWCTLSYPHPQLCQFKKNVCSVETYFILTYKTTESVPVYLQIDCSRIGPIASVYSSRIVLMACLRTPNGTFNYITRILKARFQLFLPF